jgi:5-methylcytosine-specific restriction endonuclease McrA
MPDRDVHTIRDVIYFQYAKLIARSALKVENGVEAKKKGYGFIKTTFRALKSGAKQWSDITREDWQFVDSEKLCIYCGSPDHLQREHIVPRSIAINERCPSCEHVQAIHNQVWACADCNNRKKAMGLYRFYQLMNPGNEKYFDYLPSLLEKKYLKTIFRCHECNDSIDKADIDGDGVPTVMDVDYVVMCCK